MTSVAHEVPRVGDRWRSRPVLADLLRGALLAVPLVASVLVVHALGSLVPADQQRTWWALTLVLVAAVVTAVVSERASQRLLPLTVLLHLTMLFPDRAPSRLRLARAVVSGPPTDLIWSGSGATTTSDTVLALMSALGAHDRRTRGHSERVRVLCDVLAEELRLDQGARDRLRWAALLHDVGKMAVAPDVLNKPAALDAREFDAVREHPAMGASISAPLLPWLGEWGRGILEHHERYDGSGYPSGLAGSEISEAGRIVALVDAFETMTAARAYKKPMATRAAREELARCAGTQFDPVYVRAFLNVSLPRMMWALGPVSFLVHAPFLRSLAEAGARSSAATGQAAASAAGVAVIATASVGSLATATAEAPPAPLTAAPPAAAPLQAPDTQAFRTPETPSEAGTSSAPTDLGRRPGTISAPVPAHVPAPDLPQDPSTGTGASGQESAAEQAEPEPTQPGEPGDERPAAPDRDREPESTTEPRDSEAPGPRNSEAPGPRDSETPGPRNSEAPGPRSSDAPSPRKTAAPGPRADVARPAPRPPGDRPQAPPTGGPDLVVPTQPTLPTTPPAPPQLPVELPTLPPLTPADRAVTLVQAPDAVTTARTAVFELSTAPGLDLQCRDTSQGDGLGDPDAGWAPCGRTVTLTGLTPGHHVFQTRSVDAEGRRGAVQTHGWRVAEQLRGHGLSEVADEVADGLADEVVVVAQLLLRGRLPF